MDYRIEQLRYLLREDPSSRIFYQLGELLRREGEAAEAVAILRAGLERHPRYVSAWVCLGRSQRDLKAFEDARRSFQTALDLDRENPVAARLLGETAIEQKDWLGAVKALKLSRALSGADEGLDAEIAMVESHLDDDGRLDRPVGRPRPVKTPVRCLDVVNLSADDPFSASADEAEVRTEVDDVFAAAAIPDDAAVDEGALVDDIAGAGEAAVEAEAAAGEIGDFRPDEVEEVEHEFVAAGVETGAADDPGAGFVDLAPIVDESSVGAWSTTMAAAGVSGAEAWTEPSGGIVADGGFSPDEAWAEPGAAIAAVEAVAEEAVEAAEGPVSEEAPGASEEAVDDDALPGEDRGVGAVEVTRPIPVPDFSGWAEATPRPRSLESLPPPAGVGEDDLGGGEPGLTDKRHELEHGVPLPTMTLARLALGQDDRPLAMATLESLIERDPANTEAIQMLDELRAREEVFANERLRAARATTKIAALQGWLDAVRLAAERRVQ